MTSAYIYVSIVVAVTLGVGAVVAVALCARHEPTFLRRVYWKWVAATAAIAALTYMWNVDDPMSALRGKLIVGIGMLAGVLIGGFVALFVPRAENVLANNSFEADREA